MQNSTAKRPLRLAHLVNARSANVGNGALADGAEMLLSEDLAALRPDFVREAWDDYSFGLKAFDETFVRRMNEDFDGLIVGGAVALNGRHHYAQAGMRFDLPPELWSAFEKPVVFYGISHRHWSNQTYHHDDRLRLALKTLLDRPNIVLALRNDGTREWLQRVIGFSDPRIEVIPDTGVFARATKGISYPEFSADKPNVILAFNDEDREGRFQQAGQRDAIVRNMAKAVEQLLLEVDANVVIAPHYFDDFRMIADFIEAMTPRIAHQSMIACGLSGMAGAADFYGRYAQADLVVSMRVHSMSPSVGLGAPMVPVVTQDRMTDFLNGLNLGDLAVDAFDPDLSNKLLAAMRTTLKEPAGVRSRYLLARAEMREQMRGFNHRIRALFEK